MKKIKDFRELAIELDNVATAILSEETIFNQNKYAYKYYTML